MKKYFLPGSAWTLNVRIIREVSLCEQVLESIPVEPNHVFISHRDNGHAELPGLFRHLLGKSLV